MTTFKPSTVALAAVLSLLPCAEVGAAGNNWVMTLSWSPQYCEQNKRSTELQCSGEYYFVNFGLQAAGKVGDASFRDSCPHAALDQDEQDRWLWTIPNVERIRYVWAEQGACSGLDQSAYYTQMDYASRRVDIPEVYSAVERRTSTSPSAIRAAFLAANPEMREESIALHCDAYWLSEVRVCFDENMQFTQCPVGGNCSEEVWLRPIRPDKVGAGRFLMR
ncbi:hypothetical protein [Hydrocarboniphaga sp.]|jgi:ribonuclease T2|uniref:hypothetical protein n=1 Tax=Hydrocarboniphaga sp. TaxID=2033016 RepID=UPI002AC9EE8B|nr:hypothetical protein [Hydrocarboniphaga sp.]